MLSHSRTRSAAEGNRHSFGGGRQSRRSRSQRLLRDPELSVRTKPCFFLSHHGHIHPLTSRATWRFPHFSVRRGRSPCLAQPARLRTRKPRGYPGLDGQRRQEKKACVIGWMPPGCSASCRTFSILCSPGSRDSDTHVVCEAIHSVGMLRKRRLVPELLDGSEP